MLDFRGKTPVKWALDVADFLFTKDEILNNVLEVNTFISGTCA